MLKRNLITTVSINVWCFSDFEPNWDQFGVFFLDLFMFFFWTLFILYHRILSTICWSMYCKLSVKFHLWLFFILLLITYLVFLLCQVMESIHHLSAILYSMLNIISSPFSIHYCKWQNFVDGLLNCKFFFIYKIILWHLDFVSLFGSPWEFLTLDSILNQMFVCCYWDDIDVDVVAIKKSVVQFWIDPFLY